MYRSAAGIYAAPARPQQREKAHTEHVKELSQGHIWLEIYHITDYIERGTDLRGDEPNSPIKWRLCARATQVGDEVEFRCWLEGRGPPGCRRWIAATLFLSPPARLPEVTAVDAKLVSGDPIFKSAEVKFAYREKVKRLEDHETAHQNVMCYPALVWIGATLTTWSDTLDDKDGQDDVKFIVQGRVVYANKAHMSYISPVLRNILKQNSGSSEEIKLDDTAEAFIIFMKAVLPGPREPITDSTLQLLYGMAVKYGVKFLIEKCEQHLVATKAMTKNDKVLLAGKLGRTEIADAIKTGTKREPSFAEDIFHKGERDDIEFTAEGRSIYANKEYISYHSTRLRGMLRDQGNSNRDNIQKIPVSWDTDGFVLFMKAISPCQLDITDKNVRKLYQLADYYGARFLEKSCEKHLLTTKGIPVVERLTTAQSLNKTDFIARLIANMSAEELKIVLESPRKTQLSEDVVRQLDDHYVKKTKVVKPKSSPLVEDDDLDTKGRMLHAYPTVSMTLRTMIIHVGVGLFQKR
ncbi:Protein BTB-1 [Aphelenchoides avenae]|nr:Protein BTB-1 [Aphelenchus avenae]